MKKYLSILIFALFMFITSCSLPNNVGSFHECHYNETIFQPTCLEKGFVKHTCECGKSYIDYYINELGHDEIKHEAKNPTSTECGWAEYVTCSRCEYSTYVEIPKLNVSFPEIFEENGVKYIYFGLYPQTHINDQNLIDNLNKIPHSDMNEMGYFEYEGNMYKKFNKTTPKQYGSYPITNKDGSVTFGYYRYCDGTVVQNNTLEWFKVEPIKWKIISFDEEGSLTLLSEYILFNEKFNTSNYEKEINGMIVYPNEYQHSHVRKQLSNSYFGKMFNFLEESYIMNTDLGYNDAEIDKLYLLSNSEIRIKNSVINAETFMEKYQISDEDKLEHLRAKVTDFAKAKGCYWSVENDSIDYGLWWLRNGNKIEHIYHALFVDQYGRNTDYNGGYVLVNSRPVTTEFLGIRPAIKIKIIK